MASWSCGGLRRRALLRSGAGLSRVQASRAVLRRYPTQPRPAKPSSIMAQVDGNFDDDDSEVLVCSASPAPSMDPRRCAEAAEGLVVIGRAVRQGAVGNVALRHTDEA